MSSTTFLGRSLESSGPYDEPEEEADTPEIVVPRAPAPAVRCYLDFDGTLTKMEGGRTVITPLYASLRKDGKTDLDTYLTTEFKEESERKTLLRAGLKEDMTITPEAIAFLNEMLGIEADIVIISRNRPEYISDLLKIAELPVDKINVHCFITTKQETITQIESLNGQERSKVVVTADDNATDYKGMLNALRVAGYTDEKMVAKHCKPGQFDWKAIGEDVMQKLRREPMPSAETPNEGAGGAPTGAKL